MNHPDYLRLGWPIFPCRPRSKQPATRRGFHDATTDPDSIIRWWLDDPTRNTGLACTAESNILAIDIDPRNGGDDTLDDLQSEFGRLPETPEQLSGGGGRHFLFMRPSLAYRGSAGRGVDVKANGYILVEPSTHPSGRPYLWEASSSPLDVPLANPPWWLLARIVEQRIMSADAPQPVGLAAESRLANMFKRAGLFLREIDERRCAVVCPLEKFHTAQPGPRDSGTIVLAPTAGAPMGSFYCSHSNHGLLRTKDVWRLL